MAQNKVLTVNIPGIGLFTSQPRTLRTEIAIGVEYTRLTEGIPNPPAWLHGICDIVSTLKVLLTAWPAGWSLDDLDPADPATTAALQQIYQGVLDAEARFRGRIATQSESTSTAAGEVSPMVVQRSVSASAE